MDILDLISKLNELGVMLSARENVLKISDPKNGLSEELKLLINENESEILDLLEDFEFSASIDPIDKVELKDYYQLSSAQKRLYFLYEFDKTSIAYNLPQIVRIEGALDKGKIESAFRKLVHRHEVLRTSFIIQGHEVMQKVHDEYEFHITYEECEESDIGELVNTFIRPFDLAIAPLIRIGLVRVSEQDHVLMVDTHHMVCDGASEGILISDFMRLYQGEELSELSLQFKDYSEWQSSESYQLSLSTQGAYWQEIFSEPVQVIELPVDHARPRMMDRSGSKKGFTLGVQETAALTQMAREQGTTLFMVLLSALNVLLSKLSNQDDIVIGTPTAGRNHMDLEKLIGMFVNTLALRNHPKGDLTFKSFLQEVKKRTLDAFENQNYQYETLIDVLNLGRQPNRNPLFDVMFVFQNFEKQELKVPGATLKHYPSAHQTSKFDLTFFVTELTEGLRFELEFSTELYKLETAERFLEYFKKVVESVIKDRKVRLSTIELLSVEEKFRLLNEYNTTGIGYPTKTTLMSLFEDQVARNRDRAALSYHGQEISYANLNARANQVAGYLKSKEVQRESVVGLLLDDPVDQVVSILGVLKASGGYLPIDPSLPSERIGYMLKDSDCQVVLTNELLSKANSQFLAPYEVVWISDERIGQFETNNLLCENESEDLAYIIYTSGTTGHPKGAMIEHRQVVRLFFNDASAFDFDERDVWTLFHSYSFDFSVWEMYGALLHGGKLVLLSREEARDTSAYYQLLRDHEVTILNQTPTAFQNLLKVDQSHFEAPLKVRKVIFGGEKLIPSAIRSWQEKYPATQMINMYGITETTVHATYKFLDESDLLSSLSNIGRPIPTTQIYILDDHGNLSLPGVKGEMYVGGEGVCRGYLNNDSLTAEKFIEDPYNTAKRLYKTGDIASWLPNGDIIYLGRTDDQVKIRGFRIELGEIENCLLAHAFIRETVVLLRDQGADKVLVNYFIADKNLTSSEVRGFLTEHLPSYMIPTYHVQVDEFPITRTGKLNREALPDPELTGGVPYAAPSNATENQLADIWSEVLSLDKAKIGVDQEFFELGGHSLKMMVLANKISQAFGVSVSIKELFNHLNIRSLANHVKALDKVARIHVPKATEKPYYVTSSAQQRLFFLQQFNKRSTAYNMPYAMRLRGKLNIKKLETSFQSLAARHEILHTSIVMREGEIVQKPLEDPNFAIESFETDEKNLEQTIRRFIRPFDLSSPPLLRAGLLKIAPDDHILMVDMHHIVSDGISQNLMIKEFMRSYGGDQLSRPLLQYKDYAEWQRSSAHKNSLSIQKAYWLDEFSSDVSAMELPTDYARPKVKDHSGATFHFDLTTEETFGLKELSKAQGTTMFMTLLSALYVLLSKLSNEEDIVIGTPVAGRNHADLEKIQGMFVNSLAMRNFPKGELQFRDFLIKVKKKVLTCFDHQDYQYEELVEALDVQRSTNRNPLFDVMFSYEHSEQSSFALPGLTMQSVDNTHEVAKFDLTFIVIETVNDLRVQVNYSTELFTYSTIRKFVTYFRRIVEMINVKADVRLSEIEILSEDDKKELLDKFNATKVTYPDKSIIKLFESQVVSQGDRVALIAGDQQISYQDLNARANQIAHDLQSFGVEEEELVGVYADRSIEAVAGILGTLKSGCAYLPLDVDYPDERLDYMLEDSGARVVLSIGELPPSLASGRHVLDLSTTGTDQSTENPGTSRTSAQLAYVMYTSGTTGNPKGVQIDQKAVVRLVQGQNYIHFTEGDRVLSLSNFSFDGFTFDLFMPLLNGGALVFPTEDIFFDLTALDLLISSQKIDCFFLTTALFNALVDAELNSLKQLKCLLFGGEQVSVPHVRRFKALFPNVNIHHVYGPTENTTFSTWYEINEVDENDATIPIGSGISNSTCYILDAHQKLVPKGVRGELYLGGVGISRGYLNNASLTARKFIDNPYRSGERLYKTGDMVRWLDQGQIEFIGRVDDQLKIRGFRIELGEIKSQLLGHESITETEIIVDEHDEEKVLVAYYTSQEDLNADSIRYFLSKRLPDYMIPANFMQLEAFPLTANGKVDKNALPRVSVQLADDHIAPGTITEIKLTELWSEVLKVDKNKISVHQSFFDLGGHSLKAMALSNKLSKALAVRLPVKDLFLHQNIRSLATHIEGLSDDIHVPISKAVKKPVYFTSSAQRRLHFLYEFDKLSLAYNMPRVVRLQGKVDKSKLEATFIALIERHEIFRTAIERTEGELVQRPIDQLVFGIAAYDSDRHGVAGILSNFIRPFDLSNPPLIRVGLIRLSAEENLMMIDMHHIISDGVSQGHLVSEFMRLYVGERLESPRLQYRDYAEWQQSVAQQARLAIQRTFWLDEFDEEVKVLNLPTDHARPQIKNYVGNTVRFSLTSDEVIGLRAVCQQNEVTMFMTLLSVLNVLLSKLSNEQDIVIGTPTAGRNHVDLEEIQGMFVNTLAIRNHPNSQLSFRAFLGEVKRKVLSCFDHQDFQYEELIEALDLPRDTSRNPLFDVMFSFQNFEEEQLNIPGLTLIPESNGHEVAKFDLTFTISESDDNLEVITSYSTQLFEVATIERFMAYFRRIIAAVNDDVNVLLADIEVIDERERHQQLLEFNDTKIDFPAGITVIDLFEKQVNLTPDHPALLFDGLELTYREFQDRVNVLTGILIERGVEQGEVVAVLVDRSFDLLVGIFGILKAGATYLPIDPQFPASRIAFFLEDSHASFILSSSEFDGKVQVPVPRLELDKISYHTKDIQAVENRSVPDGLAYIIYTSGSTGQPKGVMVEHRSLMCRMHWVQNNYAINQHDVLLQKTTSVFDASVRELFWWSQAGASLCILASGDEKDPLVLCEVIDRHRVSVVNFVPSMLEVFLNHVENTNSQLKLSSLKQVFSGGEALRKPQVNAFKRILNSVNHTKLTNCYGPTEVTITATHFNCLGENEPAKIPIGKPLSNTTVLVLDQAGKLQPTGVSGEICIGGVGLARGYINRDELTREKFIENPYCPNALLYKTGDIGRWLADGNIEYLGRKDEQTNIKGLRVELGEIESAILFHEKVKQAVVLTRGENAEAYIVGFYVSNEALSQSELKEYLLQSLPKYMIPTYFVHLHEIPVTTNGKLDHKALPEVSLDIENEYVAPSTATEIRLTELWSDVLELESFEISANQSFFDLGGTSLKATSTLGRINKEFDTTILVKDFFQSDTIQKLGELIEIVKWSNIEENEHKETTTYEF